MTRCCVRSFLAAWVDVQIARSAAVWELKAAIEDVFAALYDETDNKAISWYGCMHINLDLQMYQQMRRKKKFPLFALHCEFLIFIIVSYLGL